MKERLIRFLRMKNIRAYVFETQCGLGNGFVSKLTDKCSSESLAKITKFYPDLNLRWLLTGEGEMSMEDTLEKLYKNKYKEELKNFTPDTRIDSSFNASPDLMKIIQDQMAFMQQQIIDLQKNQK